ncbi:hypothetical protein EIP91_000756 [Steccherinum ochraceum]|uniref:RRM domain-containing protein n=1 Tax=Steccherinum ochraceum TaxID=92696 RepID=A0A4V2MWN3_9APHY|nr:hypothetical protein EIP91_000756 [Steccherinum ochraceum]
MDMSLDDIVAANRPKGIRRSSRRGSAKGAVLGNAPSGPATRAKAAPVSNGAKTAPATAALSTAEKIIVSGLPNDVTEQQVKELFHSTVGPLRNVNLHYDAQGRSKGVAEVIFAKKGDATRAHQQYNNRLIDGKKAMKIELVVHATPASLASRVAPAPAPAAARTTGAAPRAGGKPRRGGARGGGRKKGGNERPSKSAADLDAEMEDYTTSNAPAPAPAATAA